MGRDKKIIKISFIVLVIVIVSFLALEFGVMRTSLWYHLPAYWKMQVAFSRAEDLVMDRGCRELCILSQGAYEKIIADYMIQNPGVLDEQIERYVNNDKANLDFRIFLVELIARVENDKKNADENYEIKISDFLIGYLKKDNANLEIKKRILIRFSEQLGSQSWLADELIKTIKNKNKSIEERTQSIASLGKLIIESEETGEDEKNIFLTPKYKNINYSEIAEMFLSIAEDKTEDDKVRYRAIDKLYNTLIFKGLYTDNIFDRVLKVFNDRSNHLGIRYKALVRIKFYDEINSKTTRQIVDKIYNDKNEHAYLVYNAWVFFRDINKTQYKEPEIERETYSDYSREAFEYLY